MKIFMILVICLAIVIFPLKTSKTQTFAKSVVIVQTEWLEGTGFAVTYKGNVAILTAAHVVEGVERAIIVDYNGDTIKGIVLKRNIDQDIALIVAEDLSHLKPIKLSKKEVKSGDHISTNGHPKGYYWSYCETTVSNAYRVEETTGANYLQLQLATWPGASGSPILLKGKLVGMLVLYEHGMQACFAIKSDIIKEFLCSP